VDSVIVGNNLRSKDKGVCRRRRVRDSAKRAISRLRRKRERLYCTLLRKAGFVDSLYQADIATGDPRDPAPVSAQCSRNEPETFYVLLLRSTFREQLPSALSSTRASLPFESHFRSSSRIADDLPSRHVERRPP